MTSGVPALVAANVLMLALGSGLLPLLRLARTRRDLLTRLPLGYAVGLAATGILAADLAVVDVTVGWITLPLLAAGSLALGLRRLPAGAPLRLRRPPPSGLAALAVLGLTAAFVVPAARLSAVKPLLESDGWQIWGTRARALFDFGHPVAPVFTDPAYPALQHPLLLPALEAVDFRFLGGFDGTLLHLQLLGFAIAFVGGAWTLLRPFANPLLLASALLAIVTAPTFFNQLPTNSADIPLAVFVALGVAGLAAWLRTGAAGLLPAAALFLGAGALTKNEGECFALTAFVAAALVAPPGARRPLVKAAAVVVAIDLPWRIWLEAHHVKIAEYSISNLFNPAYLSRHADRVGPTARELAHQIWRFESWSYLVPLVLLGLAGALALQRNRLALFGGGWLLLSFAGLLGIYWISTNTVASNLSNSSDRTIDSLVLGGALLVPVILHDTRGASPGPERAASRTTTRASPAAAIGRLAGSLRARAVELVGAPAPALPWCRPRRELLLLALVAVATLTAVYPINPQDVSRLCLTRSLVHLRVSADSCLDTTLAFDRSSRNGHLYSDKAPGMSVLELPGAAALRVPPPVLWPPESVRLWAVRLLSSGIAFLVCVFLVGRISEGIAPGFGAPTLVAFALGTLVAPFAVANFEHVTAGTLGLAALALAWRRRPLAAGLAAGAIPTFAYEAGIVLVVIGAYVALLGGRALVRFVAGAVPPLLLLGLYDWAAFGAPWHLSYRYKADANTANQEAGFFGIHFPTTHGLHEVFLGRGGLLVLSPVLAAAAYGLVLLARRYRAEAIVCGAVSVAFLFVNSGYFTPYGGLSPGPRFLIPSLPFLALGLGPAFAARFRLTALLTVLSVVPMTAITLTWSSGMQDRGSIWGELGRVPAQLGASRLVHSLASNILLQAGASRVDAALVVAACALAATVLALWQGRSAARRAAQATPHLAAE